MDRPRRTIHIDRKTESLWQKEDASCLMGPRGVVCYEVLKPSEMVNSERYLQLLTDLNWLV